MILMIDNYDSFTYNLVQYLGELGAEVVVHRNDQVSVDAVVEMAPHKIVLSPGPCTPNEAGICLALIERVKGHIPILGVCLGHQAIGQAFGGRVLRARGVMHGGGFALLKATGLLLNVARGPVLEAEALYNALATQQIGGAVIDVWYQYPNAKEKNPPPSRFPFQDLDNLIMTPHNSGWTQEQIDRRWTFLLLQAFYGGSAILGLVRWG